MSLRRTLSWLAGAAVVAGLVAVGWSTRETWRPWLSSFGKPHAAKPAEEEHHAHGDRVKLTPQARKNLGLVVGPAEVTKVHWRTIQVPGVVVDRPGQSDRGVTAPITGVVSRIHAFPSDTVKPGDALFDLRITSEFVQNTQAELFKTAREMQLQQQVVKRLEGAGESVPEVRVIEARSQQTKLAGQAQSYRQILQSRGLTPAQIDAAGQGKFVLELTVVAPPPSGDGRLVLPAASASQSEAGTAYEVQELEVQLGEQV